MRQLVLDTETTGLAANEGHRIIEIGCIELINRRHSGRRFHEYLNPERDVDMGAIAVHGLSRERLASAPKFAQVAAALLEFIAGGELIIHNAEFDVAFLDMEIQRLIAAAEQGSWPASVRSICRVLDTLTLARERHPGQRNNLDALCKRYDVDNSARDLHGALLDATLLADVYLAMTGGQSLLALDEGERIRAMPVDGIELEDAPRITVRPAGPLRVIEASAEELTAHAELTALLQRASGGKCLWLSGASR